MLKQDLLFLIEEFIKETWKYKESDELYNDLEQIYKIENEIIKNESIDVKQIYNKLLAVVGIIRFKYGFEHIIINNSDILKEMVSKISLNDENVIEKYNNIKKIYTNFIKNITNIDFLKVQRNSSNEGIYLAVESLKSVITNKNYRSLLKDDQINEILIDCIKLINDISSLQKIEAKYKDLIQEIWQKSLTNSIENNSFRVLFSNISGSLLEQASNLINRSNQSSCSMISSNYIATYLGQYRRIGFIYPNDSNIIMASAYDLGSNVFGEGVKNKEKGTSLATPEILEKIGVERTKEKGEDLLSSSCYNEVCVSSKPCGILIIGFGEDDLNIAYEDTIKLANELKLPLYKIDVMDYKDELSEVDKEYIAYHSVLSYIGINNESLNQLIQKNEASDIFELIYKNKEIIAQKFMELKKAGILNKEYMLQSLDQIIGFFKNNGMRR